MSSRTVFLIPALIATIPVPASAQPSVENNPIVSFTYPDKRGDWDIRQIRLIAANKEYLIGLDMNDGNQFKKFRRDKMGGSVHLLEFNASALTAPAPKAKTAFRASAAPGNPPSYSVKPQASIKIGGKPISKRTYKRLANGQFC